MEPLQSCLHPEFPAACGACSGAICLGCLAHGTFKTNINPLINCTNMLHQHSISGKLIGWFSSSPVDSLPPSTNKHFFSEFYSGTTWGMHRPVPSLTKGSQFSPRSNLLQQESRVGDEALCTHPHLETRPVGAVPASPSISATQWSEKHGLGGLFMSYPSLPLTSAQEGHRAEPPEWPLEPLL